jgi:hypothetical protein
MLDESLMDEEDEKEISRMMSEGKYREVRELLEAKAGEYKSPRTETLIASTYMKEGNLGEAKRILAAICLDENGPDPFICLGSLLTEEGLFDLALENHLRSLSLSGPKSKERALKCLIYTLLLNKEHSESLSFSSTLLHSHLSRESLLLYLMISSIGPGSAEMMAESSGEALDRVELGEIEIEGRNGLKEFLARNKLKLKSAPSPANGAKSRASASAPSASSEDLIGQSVEKHGRRGEELFSHLVKIEAIETLFSIAKVSEKEGNRARAILFYSRVYAIYLSIFVQREKFFRFCVHKELPRHFRGVFEMSFGREEPFKRSVERWRYLGERVPEEEIRRECEALSCKHPFPNVPTSRNLRCFLR